MNATRHDLLRLSTTTPKEFIDVAVSYHKGHGYFLHVRHVTIDDGMLSFVMKFNNTGNKLIETAQRFNARRLAQLCDMTLTSTLLGQTLDAVLAEENLTLAPQREFDAAMAAIS